MITPTASQDAVLRAVRAWLADPSGPQWKYLAGYAGTGKTSLARLLAESVAAVFCAFTGKAASVLRRKGCASATTLHRLIYRPDERVVEAADGTRVYTTEFAARDDDPLAGVDLVVLDECSMVDAKMAQDLLSYGRRVLVLGDPFQLPPVSGGGYFTKREPDWLLTEVHRQAAESGILRLATDVRAGAGVRAPECYGPEAVLCSLEEASERESELMAWTDIVLVGTHRLRRHFNQMYRQARGYRAVHPERGDQLVCLQNDHRRGLLNGEIWNCEARAIEAGHLKVDVLVSSDDDPKQKLLASCWAHDFLGLEDDLQKMPHRQRLERARFAYGYALTVHKAQGSEWPRVVVVDESSVFRDSAAQWLYTAVTRASDRLVLVRQ